MPIEDAAIIGSIEEPEIIEGATYLVMDENTDNDGELHPIKINQILEKSYYVTDMEHNEEFYLLKERLASPLDDFNGNIHRYKVIEQL